MGSRVAAFALSLPLSFVIPAQAGIQCAKRNKKGWTRLSLG